jgi:hypothetical protein
VAGPTSGTNFLGVARIQAFVEEARRTLNQLNALIARAKDFSLVQEENELRDATYEFISAAKERIGGGSSEQEFDQAVAFLADTIRLFVEAVAVAILPPPPPPREDFAKGSSTCVWRACELERFG